MQITAEADDEIELAARNGQRRGIGHQRGCGDCRRNLDTVLGTLRLAARIERRRTPRAIGHRRSRGQEAVGVIPHDQEINLLILHEVIVCIAHDCTNLCCLIRAHSERGCLHRYLGRIGRDEFKRQRRRRATGIR